MPPPLGSPLTFDAAIEVALSEHLGEIVEVALERANGKVVVDIEVVTAGADEVDLHLHPVTGELPKT
ncbi:MAG: hypothetical protein AAF742_06140 [Pseudomonadota bacterium]